ncbi:MAG: TauD/TfdA family dioxygenase [Pirellulaceae bacterium]|nr:TauD/TfdA family dioxygenase [Pirellulaceae bacterium]
MNQVSLPQVMHHQFNSEFSNDRLDHPATWRGDQLFQSPFWRIPFEPHWLQENRKLGSVFNLSSDFTGLLHRIQAELEDGYGAVLLSGFPVERFLCRNEGLELLKSTFTKMASVVGTPVSQSAAGEQVFSVRNEGFAENDSRSRGPNTKKKLSFHTDRCDVISFLCVQQAKSGGDNQVVSSMSIYNEVLECRPDLVDVLMQPFFYQRHNVDLGNQNQLISQPIFSFCQSRFAANYLRVLIERAYQSKEIPEMSDIQREALDYVDLIASDSSLHATFRQETGDILFLNNWVTFHRRTEFEDHDEIALRRHLLRIWLSVPNSRPLDSGFAENYGSTTAGAIRGGMQAAKTTKDQSTN